MGDQPVTRAEFDILHTAAKALLNQMVALTAKIGNINNNNRNYNDKNNQNRRCGPIRVRGRNNQIIEDSNFSMVEKTDFEEIMSNHWKKLQILREEATSAKSIEKDHKALKAKVDEDEVKPEGENLRQQGGLSTNTPQAEKHKEVQGISEVSSQTPICESQIVNSTSITTNQVNPKELISSLYPLNPRPKSPSIMDTSFLFDPLMSGDDETEEPQGADTFDADPISEINTEINKPTPLDKQIPTKAFSPFDLQHLGEVKFQSLSPKTISVPAQSVLLSFNGLICFDPGGSLSSLFPHVSISLSCPPRVSLSGENHINFDTDTLKYLQTIEPIFNGSDLKANLYSFSMMQNVFQLFEKMPKCQVFVWNTTVSRYTYIGLKFVNFYLSKGMVLQNLATERIASGHLPPAFEDVIHVIHHSSYRVGSDLPVMESTEKGVTNVDVGTLINIVKDDLEIRNAGTPLSLKSSNCSEVTSLNSNTTDNLEIRNLSLKSSISEHSGVEVQDVIAGSYIFVCAYGSRDVRCGVCGSVLIDKFKEEIQLRGLKDQISVLACSHIDGHNYAGNLITFNHGPDGKFMCHWYGYVTRNDVLALLDQHIAKERIGYKLNSIDRENMRAGLQQAVRILIAAGTVEVETRKSDASKFLHVNEKENNGCGIITQCNSVKEDWDMDVNKSLVLPSKNKECQKHTAKTLQVSEDQKNENPSTQPPLPPKPPDICCRGAAAMRYIVSDCDSVEVYYDSIHYIDYYYGDRTILAGRKEMEFMANFCAFQFWQHIFKDKYRLEHLKEVLKSDDVYPDTHLMLKLEEDWCFFHNLYQSSLHQMSEIYNDILNTIHRFRPKFLSSFHGLVPYYDPYELSHTCLFKSQPDGHSDVVSVDEEGFEPSSETNKCVAVPYVTLNHFNSYEVAKMFAAIVKETRAQYPDDSSSHPPEDADVGNFHIYGEVSPCVYFMRGSCSRGNSCSFSHTLQAKRPQCKFFFSLQGCRNGGSCLFSHDVDRPAVSARKNICLPEDNAMNSASLLNLFPKSSNRSILILDDTDLHFSSCFACHYDPSKIISTTSLSETTFAEPSLTGVRILWGLYHPYQTIIAKAGRSLIPWNEIQCILWFPCFDSYGEDLDGKKKALQNFFQYLAFRILADDLQEVQVIITMNNIRFSQLQVEKLARDCFFILTESFAFDEISFGILHDSVTNRRPMVVSRSISYVFSLQPPTDELCGDYVATMKRHLHKIQKN